MFSFGLSFFVPKSAMPDKSSPEPNESPTRQDLADSTREITERVDSQTEAVRADLADRTETVREQVVDSTLTAKTVLSDKTEATRADLADRTEAVRVDLADRTDKIRQQVVDATHQAKRDVEDKTEATRAELEAKSDLRKVAVQHQFRSYRTWFVFAVIIFSLTNTGLYYLFLYPRAANPTLNVSPIKANGPTSLCPSESLDFEFLMDVLEQGVFDIDASTWKLVPPETVLFSESQRFVAAEPITYLVNRRWIVPQSYIDPATNRLTEWEPGSYQRQIFVTAVGRDAEPSIQVLPFEIRDSCPD